MSFLYVEPGGVVFVSSLVSTAPWPQILLGATGAPTEISGNKFRANFSLPYIHGDRLFQSTFVSLLGNLSQEWRKRYYLIQCGFNVTSVARTWHFKSKCLGNIHDTFSLKRTAWGWGVGGWPWCIVPWPHTGASARWVSTMSQSYFPLVRGVTVTHLMYSCIALSSGFRCRWGNFSKCHYWRLNHVRLFTDWANTGRRIFRQ